MVLTSNDGRGYHSDKRGFARELIVLEGSTGQVKWRWEWISPEFAVWPSLLVNAEGDGRRVIGMGISKLPADSPTRSRIVAFNPDGTIRHSQPIDNILHGDRCWMAADLRGDGAEHLLYRDQNDLVASPGC